MTIHYTLEHSSEVKTKTFPNTWWGWVRMNFFIVGVILRGDHVIKAEGE